MLNVGGAKNLLFESPFHGAAKNFGSMALQDVVQPIDIVEPLPGSAVNDLGKFRTPGCETGNLGNRRQEIGLLDRIDRTTRSGSEGLGLRGRRAAASRAG